jgi:alkanesulfonate monooxygenase SsuD/methylene tetrahydromethanopterin reductase-like flavin-dependent oxidoreductase (luciferase family)
VVSVTASEDRVRTGVMFRCATPAEEPPEFARRTEAAGFDELWVVEDSALRRALVPGTEAHLAGLDFAGELISRLRAAAPAVPALIDLDDDWVDQLTVSGTPGDCAERISALHVAGADIVCLIPTSDHEEFFTQSAAVLAELEDARR